MIVGAIQFVLFFCSWAKSLGSTVSQTPRGSGKILRCKKIGFGSDLGADIDDSCRSAGSGEREREGGPKLKGRMNER